MKIVLLLLSLFLIQDIPFKPKEEFDVKVEYDFKQRPVNISMNAVYMDETVSERDRRTSGTVLPYLTLKIHMLRLSEDESRVKVTDNLNSRIANRRVREGSVIPLVIGFTPDVKDRISPHEYRLTIFSPKKGDIYKIVIFFDQDGSFFVNGELRGKV